MDMEEHLTAGCQACARLVNILGEVARVAAEESRLQVPPYAVHNARAIYMMREPEKVCILPKILGHLVYDSFREPLPAGLRSRHRLTRRALYKAAEYSLDLRLEQQRGTATVAMVGQIADQTRPQAPLSDLPVFLKSGSEILALTRSNAFGEFQFEYHPRPRLRLYIQANRTPRKQIEVSLGAISGGKEARRRSPRRVDI
jgi:hypothetical protein